MSWLCWARSNGSKLARVWSTRNAILAVACAILLLPVPASAHIGGKLLMVHGLTDDDLNLLNLDDGSTADWQEIAGDPSYWADALDDPYYSYDPADLDFRIWLAWHPASGRLYGAFESIDDRYIGSYVRAERYGDPTVNPADALNLMVDGDHSGGQYSGFAADWQVPELMRRTEATAQLYILVASRLDGRYVSAWDGRFITSRTEVTWYLELPYAYAHGSVIGEDPVATVIEFYLTPFDDLVWNDPPNSVRSQLWAGKTIGLDIQVSDCDTPGVDSWNDPSFAEFNMSGQRLSMVDAGRFVDAVLLAPGASTSTVADLSWARIKASFRQNR